MCENCVYWHGKCDHPTMGDEDGVNGTCTGFNERLLDEFED